MSASELSDRSIINKFRHESGGSMTDGQYVLITNEDIYIQILDAHTYRQRQTTYLVNQWVDDGTAVQHHRDEETPRLRKAMEFAINLNALLGTV